MNTKEWAVLAAVVAAAAAGIVWQAYRDPGAAGPVQGAVEGITWKAGYPQGHEHLALPWDIGSVIWGPHPIYCDPYGPGKYRDPLIAAGWADWIANPPSEATI
jgi:hypothetical protein